MKGKTSIPNKTTDLTSSVINSVTPGITIENKLLSKTFASETSISETSKLAERTSS